MDPMQAATLLHDMLVTNPLYLALMGQFLNASQTRRHIEGVVDLFLLGCSTRP